MRTRTQREWLAALEPLGVPCGPINRIDQVFADPQMIARRMRRDLPHALAGSVPQVASPIGFPAPRACADRAPPLLGEHTADVLRGRLGVDDARLAELARQGVIEIHETVRVRRRRDRACAPSFTSPPMNATLDRRPAFWIFYTLLSLAALVFALKLFPQAIPLVNLDIKLSRAEALAKAAALAEKFALAPEGARAAARFISDEATQNYVELEGGGKPAFGALVRGNLYSPYAWDVRLFKAGEVAEATLRFTPDGAPYGFVRRVAETYVRDRRDQGADECRGPGAGREAGGRRLGRRLRAVEAARGVAAGEAVGTRRPHVCLRACRAPGRRAAAACASGSPATSSPTSSATSMCRNRSIGAMRNCAAPTTRSRARRRSPLAFSTASAAASSACSGSRAAGCSRGGPHSPPVRSSPDCWR